MANKGVKGRIVIAGTEDGIPGLTVCAFDIDPINADDHLGTIVTKEDGDFNITYSPSVYRAWFLDRNPDIEVRIYGHGQRLLWETPVQEDVTEETLDLGKIEIHENNIPVSLSATEEAKNSDKYWLVTHTSLDPKNGQAVRLTEGNQLQWLVDGAAMFPALTDAVDDAEKSVKFMNLFFRVNRLFTKYDFPQGKDHTNIEETDKVKVSRLEKIMKRKADKEDIPVHVLVWDLLNEGLFDALMKLFGGIDTAADVRKYFQSSKVQTDALESTQIMHAKLAIIDGETGFVIASTMSQGYFNDEKHLIRDARHGGSLIHDVSVRLGGPAVRHIDQTFSTVWNSGLTITPVSPDPQSPPLPDGASLQVLRTMQGELFTTADPDEDNENIPHGETGILEAYQRAISKAEKFIYIEDQYFTSPEIANAIKLQMKRVPGLEVIFVLNLKPDISGYPKKQTELLSDLLETDEIKDRIGVFTLWSCDTNQNQLEVTNIYVHSKVAIVDDKWATVGTANLEGAALNQRQWGLILKGEWEELPLWSKILLMPLVPLVFLITSPISFPLYMPFIVSSIKKEVARPSQHANPHRERQPPRHTEINLVLFNDIAGQPETDEIVTLREQLWEEHLGSPPPPVPPEAGWVSHWKGISKSHFEIIRKASELQTIDAHDIKILEWRPETERKAYLRSLGILNTRNINVRDKGVKLKFIPEEQGQDS